MTLLEHSSVQAAPRLLGWRLKAHGVSGVIAEVEAYHSERDRACHASKGRTPRTDLLYARSGTLYVYLCYGMHWMLNLVCDREGVPSAVLIRGLMIDGLDPRHGNGPGKVARLLGLDRRHHGLHLDDTACPLRLLPPTMPPPVRRRGPRVGVAYAGPVWAAKPWRWWIAGFPAAGVTRAC
jgi:DNA-3-methyladenine glycosylase